MAFFSTQVTGLLLRRPAAFIAVFLMAGLTLRTETPAWAQLAGVAPGNRFELAERVELDRADTAVARQLERVKEFVASNQWDEAIETLRQVMESSGSKLWGVTDRRFITVRDYGHLQLASLPSEALARYRSRIDPVAEKWYEEGVAQRDAALLHKVVDEALASSWGDKALFVLGEMALEAGAYGEARAYWEKIVPAEPPANTPRTWLSVPETSLDLAAVRARLVLVSILEGSLDRAGEELVQFARLHPGARGRLGGEERNYVEALQGILSEAAHWPVKPPSPDWPTFAGSPLRDKHALALADRGEPFWRVALRPAPPAHHSIWGSGMPTRRVAEEARSPLGYHPVLAGDLLLVNNQVEILALDAKTGRPAWGHDEARIYRDPFDETVHANYNPSNNLGVPRFTMTVKDGKLFAKMGPSVTNRPADSSPTAAGGYLVCLDLEAEGRLMWRITPDDKGWAFEGSPVSDGASLYVVMRRSDILPQVHVACFDAQNGTLRWRRLICAAETPARSSFHETTSNLLTLNRDTLYCNTNLGAVAALSVHDGQVKWVSLYPRDRQGDLLRPEAHWCRDLNPCLYDRGTLLVAPADSRRILAFDAATGQILWQTGPEVQEVVNLLGVAGNQLIASGHKLFWISLQGEPGRVTHVWPDSPEKLGYGRGILAGTQVYFPTRDKIYVFDQVTAKPKGEIPLGPQGLTGGNLLVVDGRLVIAGNQELVALGARPPKKEKSPANKLDEQRVASTSSSLSP
jgi:outer membrane protein assembly factor BamB